MNGVAQLFIYFGTAALLLYAVQDSVEIPRAVFQNSDKKLGQEMASDR